MTANQTLLQMKYARIVEAFSEKAGIASEAALDFFYHSATYELIREGVSELHCRSDAYLADLLVEEYRLDPAEREKRLRALGGMTEAEFDERMARDCGRDPRGEDASADEAMDCILRAINAGKT